MQIHDDLSKTIYFSLLNWIEDTNFDMAFLHFIWYCWVQSIYSCKIYVINAHTFFWSRVWGVHSWSKQVKSCKSWFFTYCEHVICWSAFQVTTIQVLKSNGIDAFSKNLSIGKSTGRPFFKPCTFQKWVFTFLNQKTHKMESIIEKCTFTIPLNKN